MNTPFKATLGPLIIALMLAACSTVDPAAEDTPGEARQRSETASDVLILQEGDHAALPSFDATLTFVEKTEDSRCPKNVLCFWEGQAKILLEFARSGQTPVAFEMVGFVDPYGNAEDEGRGITHEAFGLRFTLVRLDPYPEDGVEQTDPVTATMRVEAL